MDGCHSTPGPGCSSPLPLPPLPLLFDSALALLAAELMFAIDLRGDSDGRAAAPGDIACELLRRMGDDGSCIVGMLLLGTLGCMFGSSSQPHWLRGRA